MTVLANLTAGIDLYTGTILPDVITIFTGEPIVYFVGASLVFFAFVLIRRLLMPQGY